MERALALQEQDHRREPHRPLGVLCVQLGDLTASQVGTVIQRQALLPHLLDYVDVSPSAASTRGVAAVPS